MEVASSKAAELRRQIAQAEVDLAKLRQQLEDIETSSNTTEDPAVASPDGLGTSESTQSNLNGSRAARKWPLTEEEYTRYGRQLVLPTIGIQGQLRLRRARVLIVGAGGLGCPAASYLAGSGVGLLGLCDGDVVELSNLHRQVAHAGSAADGSTLKVDSLARHCRALNPSVHCVTHPTHLAAGSEALDLMAGYDMVLDCTDHPAARYLVSDLCVLTGKPLVSASALRTDGQLIVLNHPPAPPRYSNSNNSRPVHPSVPGSPCSSPSDMPMSGSSEPHGPCYRCVFPKPPPPETVVSCGEGGILGPVVGVMGVLQALEAIKLIAGGGLEPKNKLQKEVVETNNSQPSPPPPTMMLLFSATSNPPFRSIRMKGRRMDCYACSAGSCSSSPTEFLTPESITSGSLDYAQFCGSTVAADSALLREDERVSVAEYKNVVSSSLSSSPSSDSTMSTDGAIEVDRRAHHHLVDVREKELFDVASLPGAVNVPFSTFQARKRAVVARGGQQDAGQDDDETSTPAWLRSLKNSDHPIYVVCRVGNDSQVVARGLKDMGLNKGGERFIGDIRGGMRAWKNEVELSMPFV